jgi:hypothetical protein
MAVQMQALTSSVARNLAQTRVASKGARYALHPSAMREEDFGWVFFWGPREYVIDQPQDGVEFTGPGVGGGEIAILRRDGSMRECVDPDGELTPVAISRQYRRFHDHMHVEWLRGEGWEAYAERGDDELALERYFLDTGAGGVHVDRFEDDMSPYFDLDALFDRHRSAVWQLVVTGARVMRRLNPSMS